MNKTTISNLNPAKKRESPFKAKELICSFSKDSKEPSWYPFNKYPSDTLIWVRKTSPDPWKVSNHENSLKLK